MISMIREIATIAAQALADEDGRLAKEIEELRKSVGILTEMRDALASDLEFSRRVRAAQAAMIGKVHEEVLAQREEIALLRRPLWVKIVAWFARHGS